MNAHDRFQVYTGNDPYVFVSYAHKDSESVYPDIEYLLNQRYRIWLDQGIETGSDYEAVLANHIQGCTLLVAFLSEAAINSTQVKDEISFAINNGKHILPVFLENTTLTGPLALRLSAKQSIHKFLVPIERYLEDLVQALPEILKPPPTEEDFKQEILFRIQQNSEAWEENLREPLLHFAVALLGMSPESAGMVLQKTLDDGGYGENYGKLRDLVHVLLETGDLPAARWQILINRCDAWKIPQKRCEQLVQTEAASKAKSLIAQGKLDAAQRLLITAVGTLVPQSFEIKTLLEQLEQARQAQLLEGQPPKASTGGLESPPTSEPCATTCGMTFALFAFR